MRALPDIGSLRRKRNAITGPAGGLAVVRAELGVTTGSVHPTCGDPRAGRTN